MSFNVDINIDNSSLLFNKYIQPYEQIINCVDDSLIFFERWKKYISLILSTNDTFISIFKNVRKEYKCFNNIEYIPIETDIIQYICKTFSLFINISLDEIKKRYMDDFDKVEERMFIRFELFTSIVYSRKESKNRL